MNAYAQEPLADRRARRPPLPMAASAQTVDARLLAGSGSPASLLASMRRSGGEGPDPLLGAHGRALAAALGNRTMAEFVAARRTRDEPSGTPRPSGGASSSEIEEDTRAGGAPPDARVATRSPADGRSSRRRGASEPDDVQRDLAIEPTSTEPAPALAEPDIERAIRYNSSRFKDPYTISIVRDVVGIPRYPAVSDRELVLAVAQYQSDFALPVNGQVGPATTRALVRELNAEEQRHLARLLREDNTVTWSDVNGPTWTGCGRFQWDVNFRTTLRGGWLIQRIDNTWHAVNCASGADVTPAFTVRYWEAWWVDDAGAVWVPTSVATPPGTVTPAVADDLWRNPSLAGTRGTWSQAGRMYTSLTLPAGFAVGAVPEAIALPSTRGPVSDDDLGEVEGSRRVAGRWNCCDADPARHTHVAT